MKTIEEAIELLLANFNVGLGEPGLENTPKRVAKFYKEFNQDVNLLELLTMFANEGMSYDSGNPMVVQQNIPLKALCEHHLLPFIGTAAIGYVPTKRVVGLSKLTRLVRAAGCRRPTIQERLTDELADVLHKGLECKGVIVVLRAEHTCMSIRGVNAPNIPTTTSSVRGVFRDVTAARLEFFHIINGGQK